MSSQSKTAWVVFDECGSPEAIDWFTEGDAIEKFLNLDSNAEFGFDWGYLQEEGCTIKKCLITVVDE